MRDVPEATRVDAAEKARLLREIFDRLPPLMGYWDRDLRNVLANRAYLDWFGIEPETMAGMHIRDVIGADASSSTSSTCATPSTAYHRDSSAR